MPTVAGAGPEPLTRRVAPFRAQLRWALLAPSSHSAWGRPRHPARCPCVSLRRVAPRPLTEATQATPVRETSRHGRRRTGLTRAGSVSVQLPVCRAGGAVSGRDTRSSQKATRGVSEAQAWLRPPIEDSSPLPRSTKDLGGSAHVLANQEPQNPGP